jgi:glucokinase
MRLGIDVGASKLAFGLADNAGRLAERRRLPWAPSGDAEHDLEAIVHAAQSFLVDADLGRGALEAIGICAPGPLDPALGIVIGPPNLPGWRDVALCKRLEAALGAPAALENDAHAAAFAEWHARAGRGISSLIFLTCSTGVGAGLVLDGRLYRGARDLGGELGHVPVEWEGEACACGLRGCLEAYVGGAAWQRRLYELTPATSRIAVLARSPELVRPEHVISAARQGDPFACVELARWNKYLGRALAAIATGLAPDVIALGTIATAAGETFCLDPVRRRVREQVWPSIADAVSIELSALGADLPYHAALGVAERAFGPPR